LFEIRDEVKSFPFLDYNVIDAGFDRRVNVVAEHVVHATLICSAGVTQPEGHGCITIHALGVMKEVVSWSDSFF
jgi:hypothetical protein